MCACVRVRPGAQRASIVSPQAGFLPKLASLLRRKSQLPLVLRLLYNVSAEGDAREAIGATDVPRLVMRGVLSCPDAQLPLELAALAINLAAEPRGALAMAENGNSARALVDRLYQSHDVHLMKLMRNLAGHAEVAPHLLPFTADVIALVQQVDSPEMLVEMLGALGALPLQDVEELPDLVSRYSLVEFLSRYVCPQELEPPGWLAARARRGAGRPRSRARRPEPACVDS